MNILVISPEAGLSTSSLATAVNRITDAFDEGGIMALTCSPYYKQVFSDSQDMQCIFKGTERLHYKPFEIWKSPNSNHTYIYNEEFFGRPYVYGEPHFPYADNHIRYSFLASAALEFASVSGFKPNAILGHEWGGALAGHLIHSLYAQEFDKTPFFLTVHNIKYDFLVPESEIGVLGLPRADHNMDGYEYWGKVSLLKAGILYANMVLLPSSGYRDAILNTNIAGGMTGFLQSNASKIKGIQFGVSYSLWDFNKGSGLAIQEAKQKAKLELEQLVCAKFQNKLLLYALLDKEAGDTSETLSTLLADLASLNVFVLVGMDESQPEWDYYNSIAAEYPNNFCVRRLGKTTDLLQKHLAGADILFAGNLKEPSSSILLKALAAGTIPITGKDTGVARMLSSYSEESTNTANAFLVDDPRSPVMVLRSLKKCHEVYNSTLWKQVVENAYSFRYEWDRTIAQYLLTLGEFSEN